MQVKSFHSLQSIPQDLLPTKKLPADQPFPSQGLILLCQQELLFSPSNWSSFKYTNFSCIPKTGSKINSADLENALIPFPHLLWQVYAEPMQILSDQSRRTDTKELAPVFMANGCRVFCCSQEPPERADVVHILLWFRLQPWILLPASSCVVTPPCQPSYLSAWPLFLGHGDRWSLPRK